MGPWSCQANCRQQMRLSSSPLADPNTLERLYIVLRRLTEAVQLTAHRMDQEPTCWARTERGTACRLHRLSFGSFCSQILCKLPLRYLHRPGDGCPVLDEPPWLRPGHGFNCGAGARIRNGCWCSGHCNMPLACTHWAGLWRRALSRPALMGRH